MNFKSPLGGTPAWRADGHQAGAPPLKIPRQRLRRNPPGWGRAPGPGGKGLKSDRTKHIKIGEEGAARSGGPDPGPSERRTPDPPRDRFTDVKSVG